MYTVFRLYIFRYNTHTSLLQPDLSVDSILCVPVGFPKLGYVVRSGLRLRPSIDDLVHAQLLPSIHLENAEVACVTDCAFGDF